MVIDLYTDGSCAPNPGPGGWGAVLIAPTALILLHGREPRSTTNNRMELQAIFEGLRVIQDHPNLIVDLYTDSAWCIGALFKNWNVTKNTDLIQKIRPELKRLTVRPSHVRGHKGDTFNEMAHNLAARGIFGIPNDTSDQGRTVFSFTYEDGYKDYKKITPVNGNHMILSEVPSIAFV